MKLADHEVLLMKFCSAILPFSHELDIIGRLHPLLLETNCDPVTVPIGQVHRRGKA